MINRLFFTLVTWTSLLPFFMALTPILKYFFFPLIKRFQKKQSHLSIGILHPNSMMGGGGEHVLWDLIQSLQQTSETLEIYLYTTSSDNWQVAKRKVEQTFGIKIERPVHLIQVHRVVLFRRYAFFTMLMEALDNWMATWHALSKFIPDVFIDTQGCAGSMFFAKKIAGCNEVYCYVHYPTVRKNMREKASRRDNVQTKSNLVVTFKEKIYYPLCAWLYKCEGQSCDAAIVNSNWTKKHVENVWERKTTVLFPPVAVSKFAGFPDGFDKRKPYILSIGQFREEKDHPKMINAFALYKSQNRSDTKSRLVLLGGCRDSSDEERVERLKKLAAECNVSDYVDFVVNAPNDDKKRYLSESSIGIHTMWKEHFGICVVEYMASGLITIAHNSGGPKRDIILPFNNQKTGYLAATVEEYANQIQHVLSKLNTDEMVQIQKNGRRSAQEKFSEESFIDNTRSFFIAHSKQIAKVARQQ